MPSFDAMDLPRSSVLRDMSRRYRGIAYNCVSSPAPPKAATPPPPPPRRDSAIGPNALGISSHAAH
ncbi:hypothetical protein E8E13_010490 [Curvularia kusanoi]|uniref:Uncharacterized protein n=1 Tax=Curvularia kusanoi TaxID=90978 RepID=A0A9P4THR7_CURKU|nr:hypothetical protein E8E13_010490 [Curvularia kusanoi]